MAIRISLRSKVMKLLKRRTDCHTSDIGHWFAMTAFDVVHSSSNINFLNQLLILTGSTI